MGRTALYRDPAVFRPARATVQLEHDVVLLAMPDGRTRRHALDGVEATAIDACVAAKIDERWERRFVRMLVLARGAETNVVITPPEQGAVAPNVVRLPQAPPDAAIVDARVWDALADWVLGGGRLAGCAIADLARLATIATPQFAVLIGEVAAQRAFELVWASAGPLRGAAEDLDTALQPLTDAARSSTRAGEALVSALAHVAGVTRRRRHA
jgi:hypothetical protein